MILLSFLIERKFHLSSLFPFVNRNGIPIYFRKVKYNNSKLCGTCKRIMPNILFKTSLILKPKKEENTSTYTPYGEYRSILLGI